ncbi:FAD/NAD(P)-binding oxidoreductase [Streptomyces sp. ODS28]|uniref:NAD(P)/FAD-dependent oxidoreductase n=1 Tax=Streptomyces sp. ODS28 TaxID=3136688 RepID=UPI0031F18691
MRTVTIVGASLAGLYAATALRSQGYDGRLVIVGDERHAPYDRPPLSKNFLTGAAVEHQLALADAQDTDELAAEWLLGTRARALDPAGGAVHLEDGSAVPTDGVVIATGASPRTLPGPRLAGVHTLRTLNDAYALKASLSRGQARVVVIGAGFIGAEVASSCSSLGHHVTVIEAARQPLSPQLGEEMAGHCTALHADHGVTLLTGTGVAALHGDGSGPGGAGGRVAWVELDNGRMLPADVVVVGIGVRPNTDWLEGSGLTVEDGVLCDAGCVTALPNVVAVGDVARVSGVRSEHWTSASQQPETAVRNLLAGGTVETHSGLPYFWSDQYGVRIQFAGRRESGDQVRVVEGSPDDRSFLAVYEREERTTAVLALNRPRPFTRLRRQLAGAALPATA